METESADGGTKGGEEVPSQTTNNPDRYTCLVSYCSQWIKFHVFHELMSIHKTAKYVVHVVWE